MMRPFFVYIFRFIVVFTKIVLVEELREGWQWSSPDFSSGSGNVQPDPEFLWRGTPKNNFCFIFTLRVIY